MNKLYILCVESGNNIVYSYKQLYTFLVPMTEAITIAKAISFFKENGGILRTREALSLGINTKTLYRMRKQGIIEAINRGMYLLIDESIDIQHIDLVVAIKRLPKGVVCLISALAYHELTTEIPRSVYIAYQQGWRQPKVSYPPIKIFRYSKESFEAGIERHRINNIEVPIYSAAKTVVDCFKFRNRIGLDVAIEALRNYWQNYKSLTMDDILKYAKICRMTTVISPYVESIINE